MKKIKSKIVRDYVMNDMVWKVDLPKFLKEISECSTNTPYAASFQILVQVLKVLTERAIDACKKHHVAMGYDKLPKVIKEFEL